MSFQNSGKFNGPAEATDPAAHVCAKLDPTAGQSSIYAAGHPYEPPALLLVLAFLCSLFLLTPNAADPDLWGHVRYGSDVLASGEIHGTTTYSYLAQGHRWINHENIAEWVMGWVGTHFGGPGLMISKLLLAGLTLCLLHLIIRRRTYDSLASCILLVGGAWAMRYYWGTRPQIFSFACFALLLFVLDRSFAAYYAYRRSGERSERETASPNATALHSINWPWLWTVVPVTIIWTNSHGGFIVGVAVTGSLLAARIWQTSVQRWRESISPKSGAQWRQPILGMAAIGLVVLAATLINPYGTELWHWISGSLGKARPEILEWAAWDFSPPGQRVAYFVGPLLCAILVSKKPKDYAEFFVLALLTWQSLKHMRHTPFLVMALMAWSAPHLRSACRTLQGWVMQWYQQQLHSQTPAASLAADGCTANASSVNGSSVKRVAGVPTSATHLWVRRSWAIQAGLLGACCWFGYLLYAQCSVIRVEHQKYPVAAFAYVNQQRIEGKVMVCFNWAQYAIDALCPPLAKLEPISWAMQQDADPQLPIRPVSLAHSEARHASKETISPPPQRQIAVDGRFRTAYSQNLIDWHLDFILGDTRERLRTESSGKIDPHRMLELGSPDLVILERNRPVSRQTMREAGPQWTLLFQDAVAEVWGRTAKFGDPASQQFIPASQRQIGNVTAGGWTAWPAR